MGKTLTKAEAYDIAKSAKNLTAFSTMQDLSACIYEYDEEEVVMAYIFKQKDEAYKRKYYAIDVVDDRYEGDMYYTDTLQTKELANLLYEISQNCVVQEKLPRTKPVAC